MKKLQHTGEVEKMIPDEEEGNGVKSWTGEKKCKSMMKTLWNDEKKKCVKSWTDRIVLILKLWPEKIAVAGNENVVKLYEGNNSEITISCNNQLWQEWN